MRFLYTKLKAQSGERASIQVSQSTRVLIMPSRQFDKYKNNLTFTYFGGVKDGTYEFTFPKAGNWVVVIEKGSYSNPIHLEATITKMTPDPAAVEAKKAGKKKKNNNEGEAPESAQVQVEEAQEAEEKDSE